VHISHNIQDLQDRFGSYKSESQGILSHKQYLELNELVMRVLLDLDATVCGVTELRQVRKRLTAEAIKLLDDVQAAYSSAVRTASVELGDEVVADVLKEASFRKVQQQQQQQQEEELQHLGDDFVADAESRQVRQGRDQNDGVTAAVDAGIRAEEMVVDAEAAGDEMVVEKDGEDEMVVEEGNTAAAMESWYGANHVMGDEEDQVMGDEVQVLGHEQEQQQQQETSQLMSQGAVAAAAGGGGADVAEWQHVVQGPAEGVKVIFLHPGQVAVINHA
jgi:hypothetical protein